MELLEKVNLPDNQEILIEIKEVNDFWSAYQKFRARIEQEGITFDRKLGSQASPFKGIKKENIPYVKPPPKQRY
ncbi:MAG: hypothetical protein SWX82_14430 [Cyanobacteriota bacterium]|nr:hypothetical protein [Cyanobacteriota bacterium]